MAVRIYHSTTQSNLPCLKGLKASRKIYFKPLSIYVVRVDKKWKESIEKCSSIMLCQTFTKKLICI